MKQVTVARTGLLSLREGNKQGEPSLQLPWVPAWRQFLDFGARKGIQIGSGRRTELRRQIQALGEAEVAGIYGQSPERRELCRESFPEA